MVSPVIRNALRRPRRMIEHGIQVALFDWRALTQAQQPALALLHAVPNGAGLRHGVRMTQTGARVKFSAEGQRLRKEGMTKGIPDVCLPVARGAYHGLYIEHKRPGERPTDDQARIIRDLRAGGYYVRVSWDAVTSIETIKQYLALGDYDCIGGTMLDDRHNDPPKPRRRKT